MEIPTTSYAAPLPRCLKKRLAASSLLDRRSIVRLTLAQKEWADVIGEVLRADSEATGKQR